LELFHFSEKFEPSPALRRPSEGHPKASLTLIDFPQMRVNNTDSFISFCCALKKIEEMRGISCIKREF
jgi:hypothetical protein